MTDPNAINAIVRDMNDPRHPALLGVTCDASIDFDTDCGTRLEADFLVHEDDPREVRLGYILDHAADHGWAIVGRVNAEGALTYCPEHIHVAPRVIVPGNSELVGTQFPGQMPAATWDELMAWHESNGFNPSLSPSTRDVVIGATLDRWEAVGVDDNGEPIKFGKGPTRESGWALRDGEEWSHSIEGHEGTARPVKFVSTPVTVPLPQHLRTAIEKAAAAKDLPGGLRTGPEWAAQCAITVVDPDGWRDPNGLPWHHPISEDEFSRRASISTILPAPLTPDQEAAQVLYDLLHGNVTDPEPGA